MVNYSIIAPNTLLQIYSGILGWVMEVFSLGLRIYEETLGRDSSSIFSIVTSSSIKESCLVLRVGFFIVDVFKI